MIFKNLNKVSTLTGARTERITKVRTVSNARTFSKIRSCTLINWSNSNQIKCITFSVSINNLVWKKSFFHFLITETRRPRNSILDNIQNRVKLLPKPFLKIRNMIASHSEMANLLLGRRIENRERK